MKIEVSMGEVYDKLSILDLKLEYIGDIEKRKEIERERNAFCVTEYPCEYAILLDINRQIWILTDKIKQTSPDNAAYAGLAHEIMELNQMRFRVKNTINCSSEGSLKEQKSYANSHAILFVTDFWKAVPVARYLLTIHDTLSFEGNTSQIETLFTSHNEHSDKRYIDTDVTVPDTYVFPPIRYVSGGLLGDFIHQLSVVCEKSMQTGRKSKLYISDTVGDRFRLGIEHTYNDIFPIVSRLPYIESFEKHTDQVVDINLSDWRRDVSTIYQKSWMDIFSMYGVKWGSRAWLTATSVDDLRNITLISTTSTRFNDSIDWKDLVKRLENPVFLNNAGSGEYEAFSSRTGVRIPMYTANNFTELANAIFSCKMFVGTLSMPLALADGFKKDRLAIVIPNHPDTAIAIKTNPSFYPVTLDNTASRKVLGFHLSR